MRTTFSSFYPPTKEEFAKLWEACIFVPDANVLLDLYRYSPGTSEELLEIFDIIAERLWVPYQIGLEYQRRRLDVITSQTAIYKQAKKVIQTLIKNAEEQIGKHLTFRSHPFLDKKRIKTVLSELEKEIDEQEKKHPDLLSDDRIWNTITKLFENKVGSPYSQEKLQGIYKEGEDRYKNKVPPGYEDATGKNKKEGNEIYGDLVLWYQIIDKAKELKKPIIFVTNDMKEDWWRVSKGRTVGCRPELIAEMRQKANITFYIYNSARFMKYARDFLPADIKDESIKEVRDVRVYDQAIQRAVERPRFRADDVMKAIGTAGLDAEGFAEALRRVSVMQAAEFSSEAFRRAMEAAESPSETFRRAMEAAQLPSGYIESTSGSGVASAEEKDEENDGDAKVDE